MIIIVLQPVVRVAQIPSKSIPRSGKVGDDRRLLYSTLVNGQPIIYLFICLSFGGKNLETELFHMKPL